MKTPAFVNGITKSFHKTNLKLKKHSPEILVVAGTVGVVVSAVLACKATLKVHEVVDKAKADIDEIHTAAEKGETAAGIPYNAEDSKKDLTIVYAQTGIKFVKLYAPAVILGTLSITGILASNNILRKRNMALAAAYATVDGGFKEYRKRVVERFGEGLDRELKYGIKAKEIEETVINEDGTESTVKTTVEVAENPTSASPYAIIYDDGCNGWTKDPELNKFFLMRVQDWANDKLREQGYLFLNDVYEQIGVPKTKMGHIVGWVQDGEHGDPYVDFGLFDIHNKRKRAFVNGYERNIIVDFNVHGDVYNLVF